VVHAERDRAWVHGYLLPELGRPGGSVVTTAGLTLGAPRVTALEQAVQDAGTVVLVLTPAFLDDAWSKLAELLTTHIEVMGRSGRLVPLVREDCQLPPRIDFLVSLDCTREELWPEAVARLREHLRRDQRPPEPERIGCPYPGMVAYGPDQAGVFFGRAGEVADLHRRLPLHSLVMVIGPSGTGKTSLIFAGLLPRLEADDWEVRSLRPGADPMRALAGALAPPRPSGRRLLLVVDQLEELFAQATAGERDDFLAELVRLGEAGDTTVLLTMRADFHGDLMGSRLWPLTEGQRLELAPLRDEALREAITGPAAKVGVFVEPALVERLVADAAGEPGALPLLQETMALLWERRARRLLTIEAYQGLGGDGQSGLATALATRADAAFAALDPTRREIARRILLRLVQLGQAVTTPAASNP
jgi:TIR domain